MDFKIKTEGLGEKESSKGGIFTKAVDDRNDRVRKQRTCVGRNRYCRDEKGRW